jgi:hypothetical protein
MPQLNGNGRVLLACAGSTQMVTTWTARFDSSRVDFRSMCNDMIWPVEGLSVSVNLLIFFGLSHAVGLPVTLHLMRRELRSYR